MRGAWCGCSHHFSLSLVSFLPGTNTLLQPVMIKTFFFFSPLSVAVMHVASLININNIINKCEPTMGNSSPTRVSLGEKEGGECLLGLKGSICILDVEKRRKGRNYSRCSIGWGEIIKSYSLIEWEGTKWPLKGVYIQHHAKRIKKHYTTIHTIPHPILGLIAYPVLFSRSSNIQLNAKVSNHDPCTCTPSSNPFTLPFSLIQQYNAPHTTLLPFPSPSLPPIPLLPVFILNVYVFFLPPPQKKVGPVAISVLFSTVPSMPSSHPLTILSLPLFFSLPFFVSLSFSVEWSDTFFFVNTLLHRHPYVLGTSMRNKRKG